VLSFYFVPPHHHLQLIELEVIQILLIVHLAAVHWLLLVKNGSYAALFYHYL
jgi:hypothetical protein